MHTIVYLKSDNPQSSVCPAKMGLNSCSGVINGQLVRVMVNYLKEHDGARHLASF